MKNTVRVTSLDKRFRKLEKEIWRTAVGTLHFLKKDKVGLDVYLIGNAKMQKLNCGYHKTDVPTNVLAFGVPPGFPEPNSTRTPLGEIYLNPPYIREHNEDINYMLIHGILHLVGFKHVDKSDRMKMENREVQIINFLRERSER